MCGICGVVDCGGLDGDVPVRLQAMVRSLRHRGPDQSGTHCDRRAALGHARLSIIDLTDGRQPLSNEDQTVWITYNGEVYNFRSLADELRDKGHRFRTRTDTEVIVHLYEEEGIDCVHRLRGMFAMAIWDAPRRELYLVRDRLGIKPLYYTAGDGRLIFASEIKGILSHGGVRREVRADALSDYLTFLYVPAPKTMFKDIYKLPPGHWARFDERGLAVRQYWDLPPRPPARCARSQIEADLVDRISESVRMRLVSDVPLGAFLSGGVDSSAVVAMMARSGHRPLVTTSIGFNEDRYNELPFARRVARRYHTDHHEQVVTADASGVVEKLAWHYDEPFADYSSIPTYYVSLAARRAVTVALSGDGGDENFGGYRRYRFDRMERRIRRWLPRAVRRWVVRPLAGIYPKADWLPRPLRAKVTLGNLAADAPTAYCRSVGFLSDEQKPALLHPDLAAALRGYRSADIIRHHMNRAQRDDLDAVTYTDIKTYLPDDILTKVDRASMAVSLEVRVPLLDHTLVEFAATVPASMKIDGDGGKSVLKSAFRDYLDDETLYRAKQGFTPPIAEWLGSDLREMAGDLLDRPTALYADYLDRRAVRKAWADCCAGLRNNAPLLWAVLTFELWAGTFLRGQAPTPSGRPT
ncbi:MAG TPA: asparagine synthase (glutamine-hydrolyzing) [Phycisphaerae bacterium]|nr:asparagine synthase (glutamine-hydrolyzing) [Phycisphaerae bacterium]